MLSVIIPRYAMTRQIADEGDANIEHLRDVASVYTQVIVIDNGSAIPCPAWHGVERVLWPDNRGIAPAWNVGVEHATYPVLAFVTQSTHVEKNWDAALVEAAEDGPYVAMPYSDGRKAWGCGVTGWCWAVTKHHWDRVGKFDETFAPAWYEDTDWFHRAIQLGLELVNVPAAKVSRAGRQQAANAGPWGARKNLLFHSQRLRYAWKHGVDPDDFPPFWKQPLRDHVVTPRTYGADYSNTSYLAEDVRRKAATP